MIEETGMLKNVRSILVFLLAGLLFLAACGGPTSIAPDENSGNGSETRVKESEELASAPQWFDTSVDGPAARGQTGITSDAAAACLTPAEGELARLINEYRASLDLPPVPVSKSLTLVAQQHAWDSQTNGNAWPPPPPGKTCNMHSWTDRVNPALQEGTWTAVCRTSDSGGEGTRIKPQELAGYPGQSAENSYFGFSMTGGATPAGALAAWKNSPGHNALITEQGWARPLAMGVGINGDYAHLWMGWVADPAGEALLCGGGSVSQPQPTPTAGIVPTTMGAAAPPTPAPSASAGGRRATPTGQVLNENGSVVPNGLMWHPFAVQGGRTYTIVVTPAAELDVSPRLSCTTSGGNLAVTFDWEWEGGVETYSYSAPGDGNCGVNVKGYEGSTGTYNITVTAR
jgi:uncharacterized protein YkwD